MPPVPGNVLQASVCCSSTLPLLVTRHMVLLVHRLLCCVFRVPSWKGLLLLDKVESGIWGYIMVKTENNILLVIMLLYRKIKSSFYWQTIPNICILRAFIKSPNFKICFILFVFIFFLLPRAKLNFRLKHKMWNWLRFYIFNYLYWSIFYKRTFT